MNTIRPPSGEFVGPDSVRAYSDCLLKPRCMGDDGPGPLLSNIVQALKLRKVRSQGDNDWSSKKSVQHWVKNDPHLGSWGGNRGKKWARAACTVFILARKG